MTDTLTTPSQADLPTEDCDQLATEELAATTTGPKTVKVPLSAIVADPKAQPRVAGINPSIVDEYAVAMESGAHFPPLVVCRDADNVHWLASGFHRHSALLKRQIDTVECVILPGSLREAILYSVGQNYNHGVRRTPADIRRAVFTLLEDDVWGNDSDRSIGLRCKLHHQTVGRYREEFELIRKSAASAKDDPTSHLDDHPDKTRTVRRGNSTYRQKVAKKSGKPKGAIAQKPSPAHVDNRPPEPDMPIAAPQQDSAPVTAVEPRVPDEFAAPGMVVEPAPAVEVTFELDHTLIGDLGVLFDNDARCALGGAHSALSKVGDGAWQSWDRVKAAREVAAAWQALADRMELAMPKDRPDDGQVDIEELLKSPTVSAAAENSPPSAPIAEPHVDPVSGPPPATAADGEQGATPEAELEEIVERITMLELDVPLDVSVDPTVLMDVAKLLERSWKLVQELVSAKDNPDKVFRLAKRTEVWKVWATRVGMEKECPFLRQFCNERGVKIALPHAAYQGGRARTNE